MSIGILVENDDTKRTFRNYLTFIKSYIEIRKMWLKQKNPYSSYPKRGKMGQLFSIVFANLPLGHSFLDLQEDRNRKGGLEKALLLLFSLLVFLFLYFGRTQVVLL